MEIILSKDHLAHFPKGEIYDGKLVRPFECPERWDQIVNSLNNLDVPVIIGAVTVISLSFILINIFVDEIYKYLDPRIN